MKHHKFAAVDLGATSGRVMLAGFDGERLSLTEIHRFPNEPVRYGDGLHWDAARLWLEVRRGLEMASRRGEGHIDSIGVDGWGVDYAFLGERGELIGNPYHYRDSRTDGKLDEILRILDAGFLYETTGIQFMAINTLCQLYAAEQHTPRLLRLAETLLTIPDLINFWLTGVAACEYTNASTTQMLDIRTRVWSEEVLAKLEIPSHFLPELIQPGSVLGPVKMDYPMPGTVVVAPACHDTGSAFAAVATGDDTAFLSSGTWSLFGAEMPAAIVNSEARRLNFTNEGGVCGTVRLLKNITGLWLLESCRKAWDGAPLDELLAAAAESPRLAHVIDPDHASFVHPESMTGAIDGYCRSTGQSIPGSKGAYTRAIFESLALKYRTVLADLEVLTGRRFKKIRVVGGGSRIALLNQFIADACSRVVIAGPAEATALGNVAMQMLATGAVRSLAEARDVIGLSFPPVVFEPRDPAGWDGVA
jgi:rhamnulokinase